MICAVVLAAGRSERMGTQKLLLPLGGKPVIVRIVDELFSSPVERILVVTGRDGPRLREVLGDRPVQFVENPDPGSDMLGSIRYGLRALPAGFEAVLMALGDQPGVTATLVSNLIRCFREGNPIVVPACEGHRGHPVLLSTRFYEEILTGHDREGLRGLLEAHTAEVFRLPVTSRAVLEDMDTPADYQRHERRSEDALKQRPARPRDQSG